MDWWTGLARPVFERTGGAMSRRFACNRSTTTVVLMDGVEGSSVMWHRHRSMQPCSPFVPNLRSVLTPPQAPPHNEKEIGSMVALCHTTASILHRHHIREEKWPWERERERVDKFLFGGKSWGGVERWFKVVPKKKSDGSDFNGGVGRLWERKRWGENG